MDKEKVPFYLFVCLANEDRSPTAAKVCRRMAQERGLKIRVDSAGIKMDSANPMSKELAESADRIFVMEDYIGRNIMGCYEQDPEKIICLDIEDKYDAYTKPSEDLLREKLDRFL